MQHRRMAHPPSLAADSGGGSEAGAKKRRSGGIHGLFREGGSGEGGRGGGRDGEGGGPTGDGYEGEDEDMEHHHAADRHDHEGQGQKEEEEDEEEDEEDVLWDLDGQGGEEDDAIHGGGKVKAMTVCFKCMEVVGEGALDCCECPRVLCCKCKPSFTDTSREWSCGQCDEALEKPWRKPRIDMMGRVPGTQCTARPCCTRLCMAEGSINTVYSSSWHRSA